MLAPHTGTLRPSGASCLELCHICLWGRLATPPLLTPQPWEGGWQCHLHSGSLGSPLPHEALP